jgi:hypothetical protein
LCLLDDNTWAIQPSSRHIMARFSRENPSR